MVTLYLALYGQSDPCSLKVGGFSGAEGAEDMFLSEANTMNDGGLAFTIGCGSGWWHTGSENE